MLGARPFGITPGGGCLALFITLLQFATMVRIVSDSSWDTLLKKSKTNLKLQKDNTVWKSDQCHSRSYMINTPSNTTKAGLHFERDKH